MISSHQALALDPQPLKPALPTLLSKGLSQLLQLHLSENWALRRYSGLFPAWVREGKQETTLLSLTF